jgi:hypothetical protein
LRGVVAAIFGGICNQVLLQQFLVEFATTPSTMSGIFTMLAGWQPHSVPKIWWYSHALLQENTTLVEFWAQHHCDDSSSLSSSYICPLICIFSGTCFFEAGAIQQWSSL